MKSHEWVWGSLNNMSTSYNPKNNIIHLFNDQKMVNQVETAKFADVGCIIGIEAHKSNQM